MYSYSTVSVFKTAGFTEQDLGRTYRLLAFDMKRTAKKTKKIGRIYRHTYKHMNSRVVS
jgi:hypothetical protein